MLFNSFEFLIFFVVVTTVYYLLPYKARWLHLLISSCIFYMYFIPVYILILFFTIIIDYFAGIMIENSTGSRRKFLLVLSLITNIGILAIFKYCNFFIANINELYRLCNLNINIHLLNIILPIGLSFHTFQAMSYTIEVYRGNQKPEKQFGIYALYVMFYPQLVAGPIERPQNLLYQFHEKHYFNFDNLKEGLQRVLWGLFKKIVIADRLALVVNNVYNAPEKYDGVSFTIATVFFAFQIYCDFSGYSDIAIGTAKIMGFNLMLNFDRPFSSKSISELWRRWHISLSTWFNDYLFIPLVSSFRKWGDFAFIFSIICTFIVVGFWHGAAWKYILFGLMQGIAIVYDFLFRKQKRKIYKILPNWLYKNVSVFITFLYFSFSCIFFRARDTRMIFYIISRLFTGWGKATSISSIKLIVTSLGGGDTILGTFNLLFGILMILFLEIMQGNAIGGNVMAVFNTKARFLRWSFYCFLIISILLFGAFNNEEFIYFQF